MHLALVALPIRALFIPIGFQSIRCDPNVLSEAIEQVKKEKDVDVLPDSTAQEDTSQFFYFSEKAKKVDNEIKPSDVIGELTEEEMRSQIKASIGQGEEKLVNEVLGINNIGLEAEEIEDDDKISTLPVSYDLNFKSIVTKGLCFRSDSKTPFINPFFD